MTAGLSLAPVTGNAREMPSCFSKGGQGPSGEAGFEGDSVIPIWPPRRGSASAESTPKLPIVGKNLVHKEGRKRADQYGLIDFGNVSPSKLAKTATAKSVLDAGCAGSQAHDLV
jgi:hypothetical protein